jgi:hypothetical protein
VELDNVGTTLENYPGERGQHLVEWRTILYLEYARKYSAFKLDFETAYQVALAVLESQPILNPRSVLGLIVKDSLSAFRAEVPDATTLQAIWTGRRRLAHGPDWILSRVRAICLNAVGRPNVATGIAARGFAQLLEGKLATKRDGTPLHGKDYEKEEWKDQKVDAYTACSALSLAIATTFANRGVEWLKKNWESRYSTSGFFVQGSAKSITKGDDKSLLKVTR